LNMHPNEDMYRRIVEAVPEGIWVVGSQGQTIFCNQRMAEILGTDVQSMQTMTCFDPVFPSDVEEAQRHFGLQLAGSAAPFDFRLRRVDGSPVSVNISCRPVHDAASDSTWLLGLFADISQRKQSEAALHESEERFRNMADTAPVMIWIAGPDKLATYFNRCCLDFTGHTLEQKVGESWVASVHPEDRQGFLAIYSASFDDRRNFQASFRLLRADGEYRWVLISGVPRFTTDGVFVGFIGACVDVTDLRRSQEQILARQKLESIGVLAGGIAHDFNNLLAGILSEAELAATELEPGCPLDAMERIILAAVRGAEIVRQLMIYSGQNSQEPLDESVDVSLLVEEMLGLLKVSLSKNTVLKPDLQPDLPAVPGRASQIRQIVMNLIINASEAIGDNGGVIIVRTSHKLLPAEPDLPARDYLSLEVSDTGCGMTEEVQTKVFDPFFSTKFAGRGLGLAVVQGIVRDHGGTINLVSGPGLGTKFEILLPCFCETPQLQRGVIAQTSRRGFVPRERIVLVVEDESLLRTALSNMLRKNGFDVLEAGDGSSALELLREHQVAIDVMLLDITLPGVASREVFEQARHLRGNLKTILTSAYGRETVDAAFAGLPVERFLRKPFQFAELMGLLQEPLSTSA
jgi:two-component system, cell cycle sensor histidine kinase and response regulator CckA